MTQEWGGVGEGGGKWLRGRVVAQAAWGIGSRRLDAGPVATWRGGTVIDVDLVSTWA